VFHPCFKEGGGAMHGRRFPARRRLCLLALLVLGCNEADPPAEPPGPAPAQAATQFDPVTAGTVRGRVLWEGELPDVPPLEVRYCPGYGPPLDRDHFRPNPHQPAIDPRGRSLAGAVVCLHGVDPEKARPWDLGPVRVEQRQCRIHVLQDGSDSQVGFVRRGDPITIVSKDGVPHALRAQGDAFFTLTFPDRDMPLQHRLGRAGHVELGSGVGYFWMRGHLFVDAHPYYARTDAAGRFVLRDVPAGRYRLACWVPSWVMDRFEREPENGVIIRYYFREPVVREHEVEVRPGGTTSARFTYSRDLFEPVQRGGAVRSK
jgi:hypothetical protein